MLPSLAGARAKRSAGMLLLACCCDGAGVGGSKPPLKDRSMSEVLPQELWRWALPGARFFPPPLPSASHRCSSGKVAACGSATPRLA